MGVNVLLRMKKQRAPILVLLAKGTRMDCPSDHTNHDNPSSTKHDLHQQLLIHEWGV
jgi:hypothetical protein